MRLLFALVLMLAAGCGPAPFDGGADAGSGDGAVVATDRTLQFVDPGPVTLAPGGSVVVVVALRGRAGDLVPGVSVRFGLLGNAYDATLSDTAVTTGTQGANLGLASVTFYAPTSAAATLGIQAIADRAPYAVLPVSVSALGFGTIAVTAEYAGARQPRGLSVDLFANATCDALGATADRHADVPASGAVASFGGLPAEVPFAVRVAAVGADGTFVAQGCVDPVTVGAGMVTSVSVPMTDAPLVAAGTYTVGLNVDLGVTPGSAEAAWVAALQGAVGASGGSEVGYVLQGVAEAVQAASPATYDAFLGSEPTLATQLANDFAARSGGPLVALSGLARDTAAAIQQVSAVASVDLGSGGSVSAFVVSVDPLTPDVRSDDVVFSPGPASGTVSIGVGARDQSAVRLVGLPFVFSRIAQAAEGALLTRLNADSAAEWARLVTDCDRVASLLVASSGACDASCVATACEARVDALAAAFDAALAMAGSPHALADFAFEGTASGQPATLRLATVAQSPLVGAFEDDPSLALFGSAQLSAP